jgi:hypothetical protein
MDVDRRQFLKSMTFAGLATGVSLHRPLWAMAGAEEQSARPITVLVSTAVERSGFVHGVRSANPAVSLLRADLGLDFLRHLKNALESQQAGRLIGLVDDACGALIADSARASGAKLQWLAQHAVNAGRSRHRVLGGALAEGCAVQFGEQLNACGGNFNLTERRVDGHAPLRLAAGSRERNHDGDWATALGFALAAPGATVPRLRPAPPLTGHFVSFLLET